MYNELMKFVDTWKHATKRLKGEVYTLYLAYKDKRTPWYARLFSALVVGYAFCPIDLIPDFIPILGYLDDLVLIPAGVYLALKMIPPQVIVESRKQAKEAIDADKPVMRGMAVVVVLIWVLLAIIGIFLGSRILHPFINQASAG